MNGQNQSGSSLKPIFSKSFPANNLLDLSLVQDTDPNLPFYKPKYFMFLSMTQGVIAENGRTFDKNSRITIKADCVKIFALSNSIKAFARGAGPTMGQFQIFADSTKSNYATNGGGVIKMAFVSEFEQQIKSGGTKINIAISLKQGNNKPIGVFFSQSEALAVSQIFDFIANKSLELEFESKNVNIGKVSNNFNPIQQLNNFNSNPQPNNFNPSQNQIPDQNQQLKQPNQQTQNKSPNPNLNPFGDDDLPF